MAGFLNRVDWDIFSYVSNVDDACWLSDRQITDSTVKSTLNTFRKNNMDEIIFIHLNINSIRNKFYQLDKSFPDGQFLIEGYSSPFRLDWNKLGGGTKRSHILKQTCSWTLSVQLEVCLSMCDIFVHAICPQWYHC